MTNPLPAIAFIAFAFSAAPLRSAEPPAPPPTAPAADKIYAPTDLAALRAVKGQTVKIEGMIVKQGASKAGTVRYLNFTEKYKESISLVFMVAKGGGDFTKEKLTNFVGKKVQVTGAVGEYNNNLQIEIRALDQLRLVP